MINILKPLKTSLSVFFKRNVCLFSLKAIEIPREIMEPIQTKFLIIGKDKLNHDCYIFRFKFDGPKFPLKIGHHFRIVKNLKTAEHP